MISSCFVFGSRGGRWGKEKILHFVFLFAQYIFLTGKKKYTYICIIYIRLRRKHLNLTKISNAALCYKTEMIQLEWKYLGSLWWIWEILWGFLLFYVYLCWRGGITCLFVLFLPALLCKRCEHHLVGSALHESSHLKSQRVHFDEELQNLQV